jgi:cobalt-zinc-cadmium efflux system membrane fusion protein
MKTRTFIQTITIIVLLCGATFVGRKILDTKPPESKGEEHEHGHGGGGHGHEEGGEHGHGKEGHVELTPAARKNANLKIEEAGGAKIATLLPLYGKIASNEETLAHVQPRFPGVVKDVRKRLGDKVEKGDLLAIVESNDSLRSYDIKSEVTGTVIQKDITLGEFVKNEDTIYTIADLTTVWVDLAVFREDFKKLKTGQPVEIHPGAGEEAIQNKVAYISPFGTEGSQTMLARCVVPNPDGDLRPGLFVTAEIATGEVEAPVAVKLAAIQTLKEKTVVFVEEGDAFEAREVELGMRDNTFVEVLSGLLPGDKYVSENSFILKAELGKEEAEHEH